MIRSMVKRKDGKIDTIIAQSVREYKPHKCAWTSKRQAGKTSYYSKDFATLDTETSHYDLDGWVYQWAVYFNGDYIYGRRPSELIELFHAWKQFYSLGSGRRILIYVHNLSYDMQYLKHYFRQYDENFKAFVIDSHTYLIVDLDGIRICCSYKLTNLSLAKLSADYAGTYEKAVGEIDYSRIRYQDSELTSRDWLYMFSDVASQYDGIHGYLQSMGYETAIKAPYTSTGFVRNTCRKASEAAYWHESFMECALDLETYNLTHQGFIGGQVCSSWMYSGDIVEDVGHCDFTSSYPTQQMDKYFPMGPAFAAGAPESLEDMERLNAMFCTLAIYHFYGLEIRPMITAPYLPGSKAIYLENDIRLNGKIIAADEMAIVLTELDYKWVASQYTWEKVTISNVTCFDRGPLPEWLRGEVMTYYRNKCTLKGKDPGLYNASKALLNSLYGMSATAIIRDQYMLDDDLVIVPDHEQTPEKQIAAFYKSRNSFMPYQYGVWITAHARDALHTLIEMIGYNNFLYCDTDSVFYRDGPGPRAAIAEYNQYIRELSISKGAYVDEKNILGVATDEGHIKRFKALHSKCYAYEDDTGELHVVIAGIPKQTTKFIDGEPVTITSAAELGSLENLTDGFVFKHNGGSRVIYVEDPPREQVINGHKTELASSAIIEDIDKELSDTMYSVGKDYTLLKLEFEQILDEG